MAISTYQVFLLAKQDPTLDLDDGDILIPIKDFPDLMQTPESIDTTTLSDQANTHILGIQNAETLEFTANYTAEGFDIVSGYCGYECKFGIWFGGYVNGNAQVPTGENGKFEFNGLLSVSVSGGGVNEVVNMKLAIAPTTAIQFVVDEEETEEEQNP